jgi:CHAD domain-containing protein
MRTVRRFLLGELDSAVARLEKGPLSDHAVHEIRKELKQVRAALRLLRPCMGPGVYHRENAQVRDAARPLTPMRDAAILPQALRQLQARTDGKNDGAFARYLYGVLRQEQRAARRQLRPGELRAAVRRLRALKRRIEGLPASRLDRAVPSSGLKRTYKSGRNALASVTLQATDEHLHEWRKQVTYLANQLECISPPDSKRFAARLERFRRLARHLGDDHDLAVLNRKILQISKLPNAAPANAVRQYQAAQELASRVARRREALQSKAFRLGQRLYARRPRRIAASWSQFLSA